MAGILSQVVLVGALIFVPAWTFHFWQAWAVLVIYYGLLGAMGIYFLKNDPALVSRRLKAGPGAEKQTRQKLIQLLNSMLFAAAIILCGLDHRFGWSQVPLPIAVLGFCLLLAGLAIVFFVFRANTYTSAIIETAPEQKVIDIPNSELPTPNSELRF